MIVHLWQFYLNAVALLCITCCALLELISNNKIGTFAEAWGASSKSVDQVSFFREDKNF